MSLDMLVWFVLYGIILIFIQQALYDIKKHVRQSEQYLSWIHEDVKKSRGGL